MGMRIPISYDDQILIHSSALSISLLIAGMASTIVIITGLCGALFRRKTPPEQSSSPTLSTDDAKKDGDDAESKVKDPDDPEVKEFPLPPALKALKVLRESYSCNNLAKSVSTRNIDKAISMKVPRSLSTRLQNHHEVNKPQRIKGKLNSENSLWTKTIILGEKCKVPDEEDTVFYDKKGNRITTYHKKTMSSMSMSRQSSSIDPIAIPNNRENKDKEIRKADDDDEDSFNGDSKPPL